MNISEIFRRKSCGLSFELFPPKTAKGVENLYGHVEALMEHQPDFITCTYGAGGSTRERTLEIVAAVHERFNVPVASHLTCVGSTADELRDYLKAATERGVSNIVALRGDPPKGEESFTATKGGFHYANELVAMIDAEFAELGIAVAGYPEKHLEAPSLEIDLDNLKRKVDAGADAIITQLFYINDDFFRFRDKCEAMGINVPIVPGLLPVTNLKQIQRITSLCGAKLPQDFVDRLGSNDSDEWQHQTGVEFAVQQVRELLDHQVAGIHFYVLNKSKATCQLLDAVGISRV